MILVDGLAYSLKLTESAYNQLINATELKLDRNSLSTGTKSYPLKYTPSRALLHRSTAYSYLTQSITLLPPTTANSTSSKSTTKKRNYRYSTTEDEQSDPEEGEITSTIIQDQLDAEYEATIEPYQTLNATLHTELAAIEAGKDPTLSLKEIKYLVQRLAKLRARLEEISADFDKISLSP